MKPADEPKFGEAILRDILAAPGPWFAADYAARAGVPREELYEPIAALVREGRVHVVDWVRGRGQAFAAVSEPPTREVPAMQPLRPRDGSPTTYDRGERARRAVMSPRSALVAPALVVANVVWFLAGLAFVGPGQIVNYLRAGDPATLGRLGAVSGFDLVYGEWWRLLTSCFVHAGGLHILLNAVALGSLGPVAEGMWGRWRFAIIYGGSGLVGACFAMLLRPEGTLAGASGAICGRRAP